MKSNINVVNQSAAHGDSAIIVSVMLRVGKSTQKVNWAVVDKDDLVAQCIEQFMEKPINDSISLQPENILLLQDENKTLKPVEDIENWSLKENEMYYAIERFSVVPEDLFRTVDIKQIEPATYSKPEYVSAGSRSLSKASPLYCASMNKDEIKTPTYIVDKKKATPRGISLFLDHKKVVSLDTFVDPFRAIAKDEKKGTQTVVPLTVLKDHFDNAGIESDPSFGCLKTSVTHTGDDVFKSLLLGKKPATNKANKDAFLANKRDVYWRFKLAKGTDLRPFGMEVVYDSNISLHWTLVRTSFHGPSKEWIAFGSKLLVPSYRLQDDIDLTANDGIQEMLRPFDDSDTSKEPETIEVFIGDRMYLACPKVAALFGFQGLLMKASAEPVPLGPHNPDSQEGVLYQALRVLYYECSEPDIQTIIEDVAATGYDPEEIGVVCKDILLTTMNDLVGDFDGEHDQENDEESDKAGGLDAEDKTLLVKAIEILLRSSPGRPLATPVPVTPQKKKGTPDSHDTDETKESAGTHESGRSEGEAGGNSHDDFVKKNPIVSFMPNLGA